MAVLVPVTAFSEWLQTQMRERGLNVSGVARAAKVEPSTAKRWLEGAQPKTGQCYQLARAWRRRWMNTGVLAPWSG